MRSGDYNRRVDSRPRVHRKHGAFSLMAAWRLNEYKNIELARTMANRFWYIARESTKERETKSVSEQLS